MKPLTPSRWVTDADDHPWLVPDRSGSAPWCRLHMGRRTSGRLVRCPTERPGAALRRGVPRIRRGAVLVVAWYLSVADQRHGPHKRRRLRRPLVERGARHGVAVRLRTVVGGLYSTRGERAGWFGIRRWLSTRREQQLVQALLGRTPAPRAWDDYFSDRPNAYLRVRTHEGTWLAGRFAEDSYAAGFPQEPDLLLEEAWGIDQESGALGREGLGYGLYVPTTSIAWIEIVREPADGAGG